VQTAASDVLVALARSHFESVMCELQCHLRASEELCQDFVFITLGKLASSYALRCVPFVGMTFFALHATRSRVGSSRTLCAVCSVLEQWSKAVNTYLRSWEKCTFPRMREAQFCSSVHPLFCHVAGSWQGCEDEEDKQAVLGAMAAMMGLLLHEEEHRRCVWEQLPWLLGQYQHVQDTLWVTKVGCHVGHSVAMGVCACAVRCWRSVGCLEELGPLRRKGRIKPLKRGQTGMAHREHKFFLAGRICPEDTVAFLQSQLGGRSEAARVAAVDLLRALVRSTAAEGGQSLSPLVQAVHSVLRDPSRKVTRAVLRFTQELLSCSVQSCSAWDLVANVFSKFDQASSRLAQGNLSQAKAQEEIDLQALCLDILHSLDVSVRGMDKLLWPRLLQYVVPGQYTGTLVPLSHCLRELAERQQRAGDGDAEEEPDVVASWERGRNPKLLPHFCQAHSSRLPSLQVVAAAPHAGGGCGVPALRLLQALSGEIHNAVGMVWAVKIPFLLHYLEGAVLPGRRRRLERPKGRWE
ncbi:MRO2A protein, partial [Crypturellus undulatus]|nr:MRO2A protein [Crypturellus undulatus]